MNKSFSKKKKRKIAGSCFVHRSLSAMCSLVFVNPVGRLCVLDITIKDRRFDSLGFMHPMDRAFQIFTGSTRVILAGDWNAGGR